MKILWPGSYPYRAFSRLLKEWESHATGFIPHLPQFPKKGVGHDFFDYENHDLLIPALEYFKHKQPSSSHFKTQVAGPVTILKSGFRLNLDKYLDSLHSQISVIRSFGFHPIVFLDEPVISNDPLSKSEKDKLRQVLTMIKKSGSLTGIHSCNRCDTSQLLAFKPDILHFDALLSSNAIKPFLHSMQDHFRANGQIAWGIVPTLGNGTPKPDLIADALLALLKGFEGFGLSISRLVKQSYISPTCGTGMLSIKRAGKVIETTSSVSKSLKLRYNF